MKNFTFILILFSMTASYAGEYHGRFIVPAFGNEPRRIFDINNVTEGTVKTTSFNAENGTNGVALQLHAINPSNVQLGAHNTVFIDEGVDQFINDQLRITTTHGFIYIEVEIRYNATGEESKAFDEHDRIFDEVTFIDTDSNGTVGFYDLYVFGSNPKQYPTNTYYWSDTNSDGNCDSGELFADSNGASLISQGSEDIPIRGGLGDTDGDGQDEGDNEDQDDPCDRELELADFPVIEELANTYSIDLPSGSQAPTLSFDIKGKSYNFSFASNDYSSSMVPMIRSLILLLCFSYFGYKIILTFARW